MKKLIIVLLTAFTAIQASAQFRVNLYTSYVFDDSFDSYYDTYNYYDGQIKGGFQWGVGLEFSPRPEYGVELLYYRQDTHAPTTYQNGQSFLVEFEDFELDVNYIMLGGNRRKVVGQGKAEVFGGFLIGVGIASIENPSTRESGSVSKFAWGIRGGVNIWVNEKVGIKIMPQLLSLVQATGGGAYFGTGGAGVGVSTYSTIYQFGLGGGLVFKAGGQ